MNVFELFAKISLDTKDYESGLNDAKSKAQKFASGVATGAKGGAAAVAAIGTAAKVGAVAIGAAATAVGTLTKQATSAYGEYEQLKGGVETLFGENAMKVLADSQKAFTTAGMSQNQYLETSIQGAGALIKALGSDTGKAAELMNTSIIDMADNVNKMGTSMEMVQNAYRGFSRGNFTMLDNLSLGFAGTKAGMQELLDKAEEISNVKYDINSYADIIQAIHVVQEEMGISGTTAKEAAGTIQGSMSAVKAAWENLVAGFANPDADLGELINNVVESGSVMLNNMIPTIERALVGIGEAVQKVVPIISEQLPKLVNDLLPPLLDAAASLVDGLVSAIPAILTALVDIAPKIINTLVNAIISMLPKLVDAGLKLVIALVQGIAENLDTIIPAVIQAILTIVQTLIDNLPLLLDAVLQLMVGLAQGILNALPVIIDALPKIIEGIVSFIIGAIPQIIDAGIQLLMGLIGALPEIITRIVEALPLIIEGILNGLLSNIDKIIEAGIQLFIALVENLPAIIAGIVKAIPQIIKAIVEGFAKGIVKVAEVGVELIKGLWEGIKSMATWIWDKISGFFSDIWEGIKDFFGIHSPSRKGKWLMQMFVKGMAGGIDSYGEEAIRAAERMNEGIADVFSDGYDIPVSANADLFASAIPDEYEEEMYVDSTGRPLSMSGAGNIGGQNITVILELDRTELARTVYQLNNDETQRVGVRLAGGIV